MRLIGPARTPGEAEFVQGLSAERLGLHHVRSVVGMAAAIRLACIYGKRRIARVNAGCAVSCL